MGALVVAAREGVAAHDLLPVLAPPVTILEHVHIRLDPHHHLGLLSVGARPLRLHLGEPAGQRLVRLGRDGDLLFLGGRHLWLRAAARLALLAGGRLHFGDRLRLAGGALQVAPGLLPRDGGRLLGRAGDARLVQDVRLRHRRAERLHRLLHAGDVGAGQRHSLRERSLQGRRHRHGALRIGLDGRHAGGGPRWGRCQCCRCRLLRAPESLGGAWHLARGGAQRLHGQQQVGAGREAHRAWLVLGHRGDRVLNMRLSGLFRGVGRLLQLLRVLLLSFCGLRRALRKLGLLLWDRRRLLRLGLQWSGDRAAGRVRVVTGVDRALHGACQAVFLHHLLHRAAVEAALEVAARVG
mmetsp:Transcript_14227/g.36849  ORF Transcript_14227/g.36849 Transcript_14227/m.36849 type:complete len:352 (-) Transcript_14227:412-1467(-)